MHGRFVVCLGLILLIGCGGSGTSESGGESDSSGGEHAEGDHHHGEHAEGDHHHGEHGHGEHGDGHRMNDDLSAFHGLLAPVWHGEPGASRAAEACVTAAQFSELAGAADAAIFEGVAEDDPARAELPSSAIQDASSHLTDVCGDDDQPATEAVEEALSSLHDAFEAAMHMWQAHNAE